MGGINFGWLAVWVLSPDWLTHKLEVCDFLQVRRWSRRTWGIGVRAVPRLCIIYPGIYLTTEEKSWRNLSQGNRKAFGWSAPNAIRLADLAIAGDGLDWPAGPCRPWLSHQAMGSTLSQQKYLPSCRTRVFPTSTNFESNLAVRALMWSANSGTPGPRVSACYLRTRGHQ